MAFAPACTVAELDAVGALPLAASVADVDVVLVKLDDDVFALHNECSHGQVELSEGDVDRDECSLECYLHGSRFDLRTGRPLNLPATQPVAAYPVRIDGDDVLVDVDNPLDSLRSLGEPDSRKEN